MTLRVLAAALLVMATAPANAAEPDPAAVLQAKYVELRTQLGNNQFQKPLYLESTELPDSVRGGIYALVDHPFASAAEALDTPAHWCEILSLHINTKYCRPSGAGSGSVLNVSIGKKFDQPLDQAYRVEFAFRVAAQSAEYLQVTLNAEQGPLSTRNYRIVLEAVPVDRSRTFIHLAYSYSFGMMGRAAMQVYLATSGSSKIGFSVAGTQADGQPQHVRGTRGVVERNTMRYYLAIEAFLGALSAPPPARFERRLRDWFAASERYPRQLHEMEQGEYLDMKRKEYLRQQVSALRSTLFHQEMAHVQDAGTG